MDERRKGQRSRAFRGGKILLNQKRSVIDCVIRNLSDDGACLQVQTTIGIPADFDLQIEGEATSRPCHLAWQTNTRVGVAFPAAKAGDDIPKAEPVTPPGAAAAGAQAAGAQGDYVRAELMSLRAALDQASFGVVLLDTELRAQFINGAFRKMWRLPDAKADARPAFVALMYHGRDTRAYEVPESELDAYVAERVAHIKASNPAPLDIRLANGEVLRLQCTVLPSGGRMLSYTYVTDIVRHADDLEVLRAALDTVEEGIVLLDAQLHARFINTALRRLAGIADELADRRPHFSELVNAARMTKIFDLAPEGLDGLVAQRIAQVKAGDSTPTDLKISDGRTIRTHCAVLPDGGRMLTYTDVTDLAGQAEEIERLHDVAAPPLAGAVVAAE
jgi:PAS domain-containing protein